MAIKHTIQLFRSHPLTRHRLMGAIYDFVSWQLVSRIYKGSRVVPFTNLSKLNVKRGMTGATGNIYFGLHEFSDMGFLLHFHRPQDFFFDIGANVGSYTVLASAHVGAHTLCFEPSPSTFKNLIQNISINHIAQKTTAMNMGVGAKVGTLQFTDGLDTVNHVATSTDTHTIAVPIVPLDHYTNQPPSLIKIDVEGFETEVINGASQILSNPKLKAIIIELNGSGGRYGYNEETIHRKLCNLGFATYLYHPIERQLQEIQTFGSHNTIYIRDIKFVKERIKTAPLVKVKGICF